MPAPLLIIIPVVAGISGIVIGAIGGSIAYHLVRKHIQRRRMEQYKLLEGQHTEVLDFVRDVKSDVATQLMTSKYTDKLTSAITDFNLATEKLLQANDELKELVGYVSDSKLSHLDEKASYQEWYLAERSDNEVNEVEQKVIELSQQVGELRDYIDKQEKQLQKADKQKTTYKRQLRFFKDKVEELQLEEQHVHKL